jgi:alpha-1,2-rhamnosyltransferase
LHDIIPLTHPDCYHPLHVARFRDWFVRIAEVADFFVYNSLFTQRSGVAYLRQQRPNHVPPGSVVYLGHDLVPWPDGGSVRHAGLRRVFGVGCAVYLCVGTLEPRKNHAILLDAFERLWRDGSASSLVLIGRAGWLCETLLVRIKRHPEWGRRLFWFSDVGDADLDAAYAQATALIFPSRVEGFGLPLVEALARGLPVIASDIEVFREIANGHARFFSVDDAAALAACVRERETGDAPVGTPFVWPGWAESTSNLLDVLRSQPQLVAATGGSPPPVSVTVVSG